MNKKLGVYICHCGVNISDYVDVEKVRQAIEDEGGVLLSKTTEFACSDTNQKEMVDDIKTNDLSGIIVASCSPKLHLTTFRNVVERAELNKYTYVHANIREQGSWAHSNNKQAATEKVILQVKAAIAKARFAESLEGEKIKSKKVVAVIGGGIAGIKAALSISDKKTDVVLIESSDSLGGHVKEYGTLFTSRESGINLINRLREDLESRTNIKVFTNSRVVETKGSIGDFNLKIGRSDTSEESVDMKVGSIVVATGFDSYIPAEGEFGYKQYNNIITLSDFKKIVDSSKETLMFNGKQIKNIAYIYCVGSRQEEGNTYCSRFCCTSAIHTATLINEKFKSVQNYHLTRGVRSYGKQELLYARSLQDGDIYVQWDIENKPIVSEKDEHIVIHVKDILSVESEEEIVVDLLVLVNGMIPRLDNTIGTILKIPKGRDKFFNEVHMKLRPVETVIEGITIAGTCQSPKNITESINSALSAATKSYTYVSKGEIQLDPIVAMIDQQACINCDVCIRACPFDSIEIDSTLDKARVNISTCKGCGMCAPLCPTNAIQVKAYTDKEILSMIDALI